MREKFLNFADRLIEQKDCEKIYKELAKILCDNCMFHEEGACYEKLWHINQDPELYRKVGDTFGNKVRIPAVALDAYNRYLEYKDPEFYQNYMRAMKNMGYQGIDDTLNQDDSTSTIVKLCDVYDAIVYMILCLEKNKDYEGIKELDKKLSKQDSIIKKYVSENPDCGGDDSINDNRSCDKHMSEVFSQTKHHNDLNLLAIKYDENNKEAYINIIGDYITYNNFNDAILFYNYTYCKAFSLPEKHNIVDICWEISDYYRDKYEFYDSVMFQKFALEQEMASMEA